MHRKTTANDHHTKPTANQLDRISIQANNWAAIKKREATGLN